MVLVVVTLILLAVHAGQASCASLDLADSELAKHKGAAVGVGAKPGFGALCMYYGCLPDDDHVKMQPWHANATCETPGDYWLTCETYEADPCGLIMYWEDPACGGELLEAGDWGIHQCVYLTRGQEVSTLCPKTPWHPNP
jgi:hypothetical protein